MPSKITAGPFVRSGRIGCVVGRNRLVWLDPEFDQSLWEYEFEADIVGAPHLIDGVLVVADVAGQFVALNPIDGVRLGADGTHDTLHRIIDGSSKRLLVNIKAGGDRLTQRRTDPLVQLFGQGFGQQGVACEGTA